MASFHLEVLVVSKELPRLVQRIDADVVHALHQMPVVKEFFQVPLVSFDNTSICTPTTNLER